MQVKVAQIYIFFLNENLEIIGENLKLGQATALMNSDLSLPFFQNHSIPDWNIQMLVAMQYAAMSKMCSMQNHYSPEKKKLWKI